MRDDRHSLKPGDLVRMCTMSEMDYHEVDDIDWCYGTYVGQGVDDEAASYGWTPVRYYRVICEKQILKIDQYWYIERVS